MVGWEAMVTGRGEQWTLAMGAWAENLTIMAMAQIPHFTSKGAKVQRD